MQTNCPFCQSANDAADHRCVRCGRRLRPDTNVQAINAPMNAMDGAAARQTDAAHDVFERQLAPFDTQPRLVPVESGQMNPDSDQPQPDLFPNAAPQRKTTLVPTMMPSRTLSPLDRERVTAQAAKVASRSTRTNTQQSLDLQAAAAGIAEVPPTLFCDARVATVSHRATAAFVDTVIVLIGSAIFLAVGFAGDVDFGALGNLIVLPTLMILVTLVLYRGLFCLLNRDTPGMRIAGLRLVDFDGRTPRRHLRILRQFAGVLSLVSAGVGLLWALVDEESLTWHDHISQTFPTGA
jgi:uncharacterized RDD family membrane protein YckC